MNWFYSEAGQQRGPVSEEQFNNLVLSGRISPDTLVWRDGMADWQPLKAVRSAPPVLPTTDGNARCVECGRTFPVDEVVYLNQSAVCAGCKPVFLQRLKEGAAAPGAATLWRSGRRLVTYSETTFPDRCVKCNAPANGFRLKRQIFWMHPLFYLFLLCNILVLLIVYLIVRKKAVVHIGLCLHHRTRRKYGMIIGWSCFLAGLTMLITSAGIESGILALAGLAVLLGGGITGIVMASTVAATKIDKNCVWLAGSHRSFRDSLPEWHGQ